MVWIINSICANDSLTNWKHGYEHLIHLEHCEHDHVLHPDHHCDEAVDVAQVRSQAPVTWVLVMFCKIAKSWVMINHPHLGWLPPEVWVGQCMPQSDPRSRDTWWVESWWSWTWYHSWWCWRWSGDWRGRRPGWWWWSGESGCGATPGVCWSRYSVAQSLKCYRKSQLVQLKSIKVQLATTKSAN